MNPACFTPRSPPGFTVAKLSLDQFGEPGRLAQVLVGRQILEDEVEPLLLRRGLGLGLEADRLIFHLRHALGVLGLGLGEEERLVARGPRCSRAAGAAS